MFAELIPPIDNKTNYVFNNISNSMNAISSKYKQSSSGNTHRYPGCDKKCLDNNLKTKVGDNYVFNDGRCFKSVIPCDKYDCLDSIHKNVWPKNDDDANMFTSCDTGFNTTEFGISARYIRVERGTSNKPVAISFIESYDIYGNFLQPVTGRTYPEEPPYYGTNLLDHSINKFAMTKNSDDAYIQLDLGSNKEIFVVLIVNVSEFKNNILGNNIVFINDDESIVFTKNITIVQDMYIIEPKDIKSSFVNIKDPFRSIDIYKYPECIKDGCLEKDLSTIVGNKYAFNNEKKNTDIDLLVPEDNRCFKSIKPCMECLDKIKNNEFTIENINTYFASCDKTINTLIPAPSGKHIRIENNVVFSITEIEAYYFEDNVKFTKVIINPPNMQYPANNIIDGNFSTFGTIASGGYIQASFNDDLPLTNINISVPTSLKQSLLNASLFFITKHNIVVDYLVFTSEYIANYPDDTKWKGITTFEFNLTGLNDNSVLPSLYKDINDVYVYPDCVQYGCLNDDASFIKNGLYYLRDGRCIKVISNNCVDCVSKINNMIFDNMDNDTASCSVITDTRFLPIFGRYIYIQSDIITQGFSLLEIVVYNGDMKYDIYNSRSYPINNIKGVLLKSSYAYDKNAYTYASVDVSFNSSITPFMMFDLNMDKYITDIELYSMDKLLIGTTLYIINNAGTTTFSYKIQSLDDSFHTKIKTINNGSIEIATLPSISLVTVYTYPNCIDAENCLIDGYPILGQQYDVPSTSNCYIIKSNTSQCYPFNKVKKSDIPYCFDSCSDSTETRYPLVFGRYIRITKLTNNEIRLKEFRAVDVINNTIPIYSTYALGTTSKEFRSDNLYTGKIHGIADINPVIVFGTGSYVQIDFGRNLTIKELYISTPDKYALSDLFDSIVQILDEDGYILYSYILNSKTTNSLDNSIILHTLEFNDKSNKLILSKEFDYPICTTNTNFECVTSDGLSKPNFIYNLSQNRCAQSVKKCSLSMCMNRLDNNDLSKIEMDPEFISCKNFNRAETRFPAVYGRYVRLQRNTGISGFSLNGLEAYNEKYIIPTYTRSFPLINNKYSKYLSDLLTNTFTTVGSAVNDASSDELIKPFMQLDLGTGLVEDILINRIVIKPVYNDLSVNDTTLYIINSNGNIVFKVDITDIIPNKDNVYYPITVKNDNYGNLNLINTFNYPDCISTGCITDDGLNHIDKQKYLLEDGRCLQAIGYKNLSTCIDNISNLSPTGLNNCFASCSDQVDTRISTATGRFIRIISTNKSLIKISKLKAYNTLSPYQIFTKHCNPYYSYEFRSDNLNKGFSDSAGSTGYIQIDLGNDYPIKRVSLLPILSISGSELQVISSDYKKVHSSIIMNDSISEINIVPYSNGDLSSVNVIETFNYVNEMPFDGSLTEDFKPKLLYIYNIPSVSLSMQVINNNVVPHILNDVMNNELNVAQMDMYFASTRLDIDTRFPHAFGRFIRIQRNSTKLGFNLNNINVIGSTGEIILPANTFIWPKRGQNLSTDNITYIISNDLPQNPFVQLDLGSNKRIISVVIDTIDISLNGCTIYVINDLGNVISQSSIVNIANKKKYEMIQIGKYVYANLQTSYNFQYPTCIDTGCISENSLHFYNQKYTLNDGRCFKAKNNSLVSNCLDMISSPNMSPVIMDSCFSSCEPTVDTRYLRLIGRFIRLTRIRPSYNGDINLRLSYLGALDKNNAIITTPNIIGHAQPLENNYYGEYLIDQNSGTISGATGINGYLQIDLGSDYEINSIRMESASTNSHMLDGTRLQIIKQNKVVLFSTDIEITDATINFDVPINNMNVYINQFDSPTIDISESFNWPCYSNTDCITRSGRTKPFFRYNNLPDNRCVVAKSVCSSDNCINSLIAYNMSDTNILNQFESCDASYHTQFSTIIGNIIRLRRINSSTQPIRIKSFIVYDKYGTKLTTPSTKTYVKPLAVPSYGKYMVDDDELNPTYTTTGVSIADGTDNYGYIQIDLGNDTEIGNIKIETDNPPSLVNTELIIANSLKNIVYRKLFTSLIPNGTITL